MKQVNTIAEQELALMLQAHGGSHEAVCEALLREMDDWLADILDDKHAEWERFGVNPKAMERAKKAKPRGKQKLEPEVQVDLATLIEEQEKERRHDALVSALASIDDEDNENDERSEEDDAEEIEDDGLTIVTTEEEEATEPPRSNDARV